MTKIINHTPQKKRRSNIVADIYRDMYTGKQRPISDAFFNRLAVDYTNWAKNDKHAIKPTQFSNKMGIPRTSFQRWCKTKEPLIQAHEAVMSIIADRREVGMLYGEMKERPVMHMMHRYDKDWKEADKRWAELKKQTHQNQPANTPITVIMEKFPESNKVPPKGENRNEQN